MSNTENIIPSNPLARRSFLKALGAVGVVGAGSSLLAACGGGSSDSSSASNGDGGAAGGGEINAFYAFSLSGAFDPAQASSAVGVPALWHIMEGITDLSAADRKPYPALAKEMPTKVDDVTWEAELRDGAVFQDGSPVTTEDVVWSFQRVTDPATKSLLAPFLAFLKDVEAVDDKKIRFNLNYPYADFLELITVVKIVPKALTDTEAKLEEFKAKPIGSGPYKLVSAESALVVMEKFDGYNGSQKAYADKLTWHCSTEGSARVSALQSGSAAAIQNVPFLNVDTVKSTATVADEQGFNLLFLMFNCKAKPFDDVRVRQALFYALDMEQIVKVAANGYATPATCYLDDKNPGYQKASTVYSHDPDKARELLKEAGVDSLDFELVTTDVAFVKAAGPIIQSNWKEIGVNVTLNPLASSAVYQTEVPSEKFRALLASGDPSIYGSSADLLLRWYYASDTWMGDRARFSDDPEFLLIKGTLDKASQEQDDSKREALYKEVFDAIATQVPLYPIFHVKNVTGWNEKQIEGFKPSPSNALVFLNVKKV
ncbi:peptide ABC transporter substrate-binding protein [Corynebacterium sp. 13CS0277]|uniref:ABC transporter substrate-binding protein n=1 Tax=Corynebacterium sp. 13CS0277 TaxID=2071994 RepID=UPI000D04670B|nr:ABC transporter substrate-binding protein [Corynebacterium sp. 13CS0277]PRQ12605.1 peptide ABC transporter substrate-binding protein [Corynebacterium sp. 13CS0277]